MTPAIEHIGVPQSLAEGLGWPESPRWHSGTLWFTDAHKFRLMKWSPSEGLQVVAEVPGRPAGLGFFPDGRMLLATALDRKLWWVAIDGTLSLAVDLSGHVKGLLNDMIVDARGRAWVGDTGFDLLKGEPQVPGSLLSWCPGEDVRIAAQDVLFPNGLAVPPSGDQLFLAETFGNRVSVFELAADGGLSGRRVHASLIGRPDGMCLDADGGLWVALLWDGKFQRIDSQGRVTHEISLQGERAISCVLGGEDRGQLFLGVSRVDESDKANVRREGCLRLLTAVTIGAGIP
jgi:sugar lactone lactonase YvrE